MKSRPFLLVLTFIFLLIPSMAVGENLPKIAVWDLQPSNIPSSYAELLTSNLVSEIAKLKRYEVISQENIRTVAGWTEEKMKLGCTDTKCLMALGQMDISKLISGRVGKIGNTYSISLYLFDTEKIKSENSISEQCRSEDELIPLVRQTVRKLLEVQAAVSSRKEAMPPSVDSLPQTNTLPSPMGPSKKPIILKMEHPMESTDPLNLGVLEFAKLVAQRTKNELRIDIYSPGNLASYNKTSSLFSSLREKLSQGVIDLTFDGANLGGPFDYASVLPYSFLFRDREHIYEIIDGPNGRKLLSTQGGNLWG